MRRDDAGIGSVARRLEGPPTAGSEQGRGRGTAVHHRDKAMRHTQPKSEAKAGTREKCPPRDVEVAQLAGSLRGVTAVVTVTRARAIQGHR